MATLTRVLSETVAPDGGVVRFEYDYDSVSLRITALRCVNGSAGFVYISAKRLSNNVLHEVTAPPGTSQVAVPTTPAARLQLFTNADGKLDGVEIVTAVPAP